MNVLLLLLDDGWAAERIAEALYIDAETVREYRRLYKSSGVTGLERLAYVGAEPDLTTEQRATLSAELEARLYMTSKEVCAFVAAKFGVEYTPNAMSKLLNRLGFVYKKPKRVPAKANAAAQQQLEEQTLAPLMAEAGAVLDDHRAGVRTGGVGSFGCRLYNCSGDRAHRPAGFAHAAARLAGGARSGRDHVVDHDRIHRDRRSAVDRRRCRSPNP